MADSSLILKWMDIAHKRENVALRMELCVLRDFLDGILDDHKEYVMRHLPEIRRYLGEMRQTEDVVRITAALDTRLEVMGWL